MERRFYKCTLLADIVINMSSATEGLNQSLNYIPGSNFLGIVARHYDELKQNGKAYDIFHSGKVRFGDAHIAIDNKRSHKKPLSWFQLKNKSKDERIYLHHMIKEETFEDLVKNGKQLKQLRDGYFITDNQEVVDQEINHTFSLKSAYDTESRRSKEHEMYGYDALVHSSEWIFHIDAEAEDLSLIEQYLLGERSIGRSKSSQYGQVYIEKLEDSIDPRYPQAPITDGTLLIYFDANASFLDENSQFTYQPSIKDLKLPEEARIDWSKSQIRPYNYSPYNAKRRNRDYDRICISKGSVLVITNLPADFSLTEYKNEVSGGLGLCKSEGLGEVLINPNFLYGDSEPYLLNFKSNIPQSTEPVYQQIVKKGKEDDFLFESIKKINEESENEYTVYDMSFKYVHDNFKGSFKQITASQWGQVRNIAIQAESKEKLMALLFEEKTGFLMHGKSEKQWKKVRDKLKDNLESIDDKLITPYLVNVSSLMIKEKQGEKND
ncbi:MAG: hypothetical protein RBS16_08990 [Candidatus Cloacimonadales bacterium]|nr:hypothetical protein [Candidatus Cloacimonadales bacterium]